MQVLGRLLLSTVVLLASFAFGRSKDASALQSPQTSGPKSPQTSGPAKPPALPGYETSPFDTTVEHLRIGFRGHLIEQAVEAFAPKERGEFETTAEYQARTAKVPIRMKLAFVYGDQSLLSPAYDADKAEFTIGMPEDEEGPVIGNLDPLRRLHNPNSERAIRVLRRFDEMSKYPASNAFGASVTIEKIRLTIFGIAFSNRGAPGPPAKSVTLHVERVRAPALKSSIGLIFVCEQAAAPPAVLLGLENFPPPSFTNPTDVLHWYKYLRVSLLSVWLYDIKTGAVLKKIDDY